MSLCYNPSANSIIVNIIKARNLKAMDIGGTSGAEASHGRMRRPSGWLPMTQGSLQIWEIEVCQGPNPNPYLVVLWLEIAELFGRILGQCHLDSQASLSQEERQHCGGETLVLAHVLLGKT